MNLHFFFNSQNYWITNKNMLFDWHDDQKWTLFFLIQHGRLDCMWWWWWCMQHVIICLLIVILKFRRTWTCYVPHSLLYEHNKGNLMIQKSFPLGFVGPGLLMFANSNDSEQTEFDHFFKFLHWEDPLAFGSVVLGKNVQRIRPGSISLVYVYLSASQLIDHTTTFTFTLKHVAQSALHIKHIERNISHNHKYVSSHW